MLIRPSFVLRLPSHFNERKTTMETEKKPQTKKAWITPELIVLVRSKPEEAVLLTCKLGPFSNVGLAQNNTGCQWTNPCSACSNLATS
jgi:hypothetical protein